MKHWPLLSLVGATLFAQERPIVLKTSTLYDGNGKTLHNTIVVVEGSKIARLGGTVPGNAITYDLATLTVTPGWIDTHAHIVNHFDNGNRLSGSDEPVSQASWHIAGNSVATLNAGFTTIQSPGAIEDKDLRRRSTRPDARSAHPHIAAGVDRNQRRRHRDAPVGSRAQAARRGLHQAVRVQKHSRRWPDYADGSAGRSCVRRSEIAGAAHDRACPLG